MPANLPPQYFESEQRYREAKTPQAKIEALEEMLTIMPKHKGTDKLRADLRRRIAKCKTQAQQKKGAGRRDSAYAVDKEGAAQVVLVGPPNVGKSALVAKLTNASPEVAAFPHSTWKPTPGMVPFENIQFQFVDMPPLTKEYIDSWMTDLIRRADIILIMLDLRRDPIKQLDDTLEVLRDLRVVPQGIPIPEDFEKRPFVTKTLVAVNKMDDESADEDFQIFLELAEMTLPCVGISILEERNLNTLIEAVYDLSSIIRVYSKAPGKDPDKSSPFVLEKDSTLEELAGKIHKDFVKNLKFAKIWGDTVFDGQMVQRQYVLQDGDVVEVHI